MEQMIDDLIDRWRAQPPVEEFPAARIDDLRAAGLLAAFLGMLAGSLMPQVLADHKGHVHHYQPSART